MVSGSQERFRELYSWLCVFFYRNRPVNVDRASSDICWRERTFWAFVFVKYVVGVHTSRWRHFIYPIKPKAATCPAGRFPPSTKRIPPAHTLYCTFFFQLLPNGFNYARSMLLPRLNLESRLFSTQSELRVTKEELKGLSRKVDELEKKLEKIASEKAIYSVPPAPPAPPPPPPPPPVKVRFFIDSRKLTRFCHFSLVSPLPFTPVIPAAEQK